ncbi:serine/threonine protein kinase [Gordonia oryzae]|uniref:non-specific serine/threonine protein kinase n=1 Tax=Gordonia oryzae TaxID=2487349 RepID=A0A3N4GDF5_9ACTN|nr:serine/threonine-protein kinase [Gordonia oryzae]RPA59918.1 serine/threonine protein kinase [Gordonia oryzae]
MVYQPGDSFAGYTITRLIGRGGMGEVYLARHPSLPRNEAVKILPSDLSRDPMFRQRFMREAELASSIVHPNIVTIYNSGEYEGHLWLAMEYIDGVDGGELLRRSPRGLNPMLVSAIATAVAAALDAAHTRGLLHRDVKPANILIAENDSADRGDTDTPPRVLLADFGIAKSAGDVSNLTAANMFLGTVAYVAPEQLLGAEVDGQADQYSLAATLFQFLCGRPPFEGTSQANVIAAHLSSAAPAVSSLRPGTSATLDEVMLRALAKTPGDRFGSCGELAAQLVLALRASPTRVDTPIPGPTEVIRTARPTVSTPPVLPPPVSTPPVLPPPVSHLPVSPYAPPQYFPQSAPSGAFAGQPNRPGQPSHPGFTGGYPMPPARRSRGTVTIVVVSLVALVVVIIAGVVVANLISDSSSDTRARSSGSASTTGAAPGTTTPYTRPPVTEAPTSVTSASQITVGNCVQIGRDRDVQGNVSTSKVDCATPAMTFYAAGFIADSADCPNDHNASLTFGDSGDKLCLTPNFAPQECYQIPSSGGSLSDYHEVACGSAAAAGTVAFRVTNRSTSALTCASGEVRWTFEQPLSLGYCLAQV